MIPSDFETKIPLESGKWIGIVFLFFFVVSEDDLIQLNVMIEVRSSL